MADQAAVLNEGLSPAENPLVTVSFQRNVRRKEKYLEAEPKALGITQIGLGLFQVTCVAVFMINGAKSMLNITFIITSVLVIIAGSLAIAAKNLHLPTLRACLAMQILACAASIVNLVMGLGQMDYMTCYSSYYRPNMTDNKEICHKLENANSHMYAEDAVIHAALFAISVTLAAYCCKVVNCCSPAPKMPVITVQAPPAPQ